jgi:hypothetical protein
VREAQSQKEAHRPQSETAINNTLGGDMSARQHRRQPFCDSEAIRNTAKDQMNSEGGADERKQCKIKRLLHCTKQSLRDM